jgi:hypothetical protein
VIRRASRAGECATILAIKMTVPKAEVAKSDADPVAVYRVARILRTELRGEDVVARLAPLEFGVALPDTNADGGEIVVNWITAQLLEHGIGGSGADDPTVSIGRATFEPTYGPVDAAELLAAARRSHGGPSHLVGQEGRQPIEAPQDELAARRSLGEWTASRRHLRPIRSTDT